MLPAVDLARGFEIEDPSMVVPWGITADQFRDLLPSAREVTVGYQTHEVVSLGGLRHMLGFHFEPRTSDGQLVELELFRKSYPDQKASFQEFQEHLEATFGRGWERVPGSEGLPSYRWTIDGAEILHYLFDRFGPEEHVRIRQPAR